MPSSDYVRTLREKVGHDLVVMPSVSGLVFDEQRRVLLVHHIDLKRWEIPGGSIDPHEFPADAVVREVWEEAGLLTVPVRVAAVLGGPTYETHYPNGDRMSYVITVFECAVHGGRLGADLKEVSDARFFSIPEIQELNCSPWVRPTLRRIGQEPAAAVFEPPTWTPPD